MKEGDQAKETPWVERLPGWTAPAILLGVPLLVYILVQIDRSRFYDNFVWKYYWGPIVSDGLGRSQCVNDVCAQSGYNLVNTFTWALLLGVCILGLAQLISAFKAKMDSKLILGATAWVVSGSVWHVMQDVDLFVPPLEYIFITPPIYLLFGAFGVVSFLIGQYMAFVAKHADLKAALQKLWSIMSILVLIWVALWWRQWEYVVIYVNPLYVALAAAATFFLIRYLTLKKGEVDVGMITGVMAIPSFILVIAYIVSYLEGTWGDGVGMNAMESAWIWSPIGAAAIVGVIYAVARKLAKSGSDAAMAYFVPINLVLIFSQALDGVATSIGLDMLNYTEKHVLSEWVINSFQSLAERIGWEWGAAHPTFLAFLPLKVAIATAVVYAIDVYSKEDLEKYPTQIGLVKFAIIMVGIGPGIRNMVRMSLGQ